MRSVVEFLLFQLGWFGAVQAAAAGEPAWGVALLALLLALHVARAPRPRRALLFLVAVALLGTALDSVLERCGVLHYRPEGRLAAGVAPLWIGALWALFASALCGPLQWLRAPLFGVRHLLAATFGAVGACLSFLGAERLGAVTLARPLPATLLAIGASWAVVTPALLAGAAALFPTSGAPRPRSR
ncbi:MAG: DUF2878 domain-containing protein [Planctomycetes bacterium]|nr:DUF2878 domain-containing protein [Planctomycetota bacterium]